VRSPEAHAMLIPAATDFKSADIRDTIGLMKKMLAYIPPATRIRQIRAMLVGISTTLL